MGVQVSEQLDRKTISNSNKINQHRFIHRLIIAKKFQCIKRFANVATNAAIKSSYLN